MSSVAFDLECPGSEPIEFLLFLGRPEHRSCAVNEEHPYVRVSTFGDTPESSVQATGTLPRRKAEIAGEMATSGKATDVTDECDECSGSQQSDAGDSAQTINDGIIPRQILELAFDLTDSNFEISDFSTRLV